MNELQGYELELLKEFIRVCEANDLKYYVIGGTALGAVRHGGFIPWDDDIDIGMPKDSYDKLIAISSKVSTESFFIDHENIHLQCILRVFNKNIDVKHDGAMINNPWLDIWEMYKLPNNIIARNLNYYAFRFVRAFYQLSLKVHAIHRLNKKGKSKWKVVVISLALKTEKFYTPLTTKLCAKLRQCADRIASCSKRNNSDYCGSLWGFYKKREIYRTEWFGEGVAMPFEDIEVIVPVNYHALLSHVYGDYMTLPPPEERFAHGAELVNH